MDDVVTKEYTVSELNAIEERPEDKPETQVMDFNNPDYRFEAKNCNYRQHGYFLACISCELEHGVFIGANKIMVGVDEQNRPIVKTRGELDMA